MRNATVVGLVLAVLVLGFFLGFGAGARYVEKSVETVTKTTGATAFSPTTIIESLTITMTKTSTSTEIVTTTTFETIFKEATETVTVTSTETQTTVAKTIKQNQILGICFSRTMSCSSIIAHWISRANQSIHVMIYSFTLDELSDALIDAKNRGIDVKVVIEDENAHQRGSEYAKLLSAGVNIRLDGNPYLMHHKVMIVDGKLVITGSYNWSWSAENRNDENLVIIMDEDTVHEYEGEFQRVWSTAG